MNRPQTQIVHLLVIAVLVVGASKACAQGVINKEPEIKAGVIPILPKVVTWPPDAAPGRGMPTKIGVLGPDPFQEGAINHLDRKLAGQNVAIERFAAIENFRPCHILIVSKSVNLQTVLAETQGQHVLVVAEAPGQAKAGAAINLTVDPQENRLQMEINPAAIKLAGLKIHSGVYRLAMVKVIQ